MSTVEATSGTTTHPHHPSSAVRDRALALGVLAVLAGIGAVVTAVWDWARDADIPNTLPTMLGIAAAGAGIAALVLHTSHRQAMEMAALSGKVIAVPAFAARLQHRANGHTDRSDYWAVYTDVLTDLAGLGGGYGDRSPENPGPN